MFFFSERAAARASTMNLYIGLIFVLWAQKHSVCYWKTELGESYQGLLELLRAQ